MKLKLKHQDFCDGCEQLEDLPTLGQHKRCKFYKINMLPQEDTFFANRGLGYLARPEKCKKENEIKIKQ